MVMVLRFLSMREAEEGIPASAFEQGCVQLDVYNLVSCIRYNAAVCSPHVILPAFGVPVGWGTRWKGHEAFSQVLHPS